MVFGPGSSPLQDYAQGLRQLQHHRFLQSMVYLALFVYGNALFYTQSHAVGKAVAWGFVGLSAFFLIIEIFRAWGQTRYQPVLKTFEETAVALGSSAMYGGGCLYWILQSMLG
jgi:hypothetical protein